MVFFTCGSCGEALKKNQVEKHCNTRCRNCQVLSCIDCGVEFWGDDYVNHIKCISEEEKYSAKGFVPKENKGEVKQEKWMKQVQGAIAKCKCRPQVKNVLVKMLEYTNIPRKEKPFMNFVSNSFGLRNQNLAAEVWTLLSVEAKTIEAADEANKKGDTNGCDVGNEKPLNKKEKKEERQKAAKVEKKQKKNVIVDEESSHVDNGHPNECNGSNEREKSQKKKSHKKRKSDDAACGDIDDDEKRRKLEEGDSKQIEPEELEEKEEKRKKFNVENVIICVLHSSTDISIKRLKKKVLSEYRSQGQPEHSEKKMLSKFDKKLSSSPLFKVSKERVSFVS